MIYQSELSNDHSPNLEKAWQYFSLLSLSLFPSASGIDVDHWWLGWVSSLRLTLKAQPYKLIKLPKSKQPFLLELKLNICHLSYPDVSLPYKLNSLHETFVLTCPQFMITLPPIFLTEMIIWVNAGTQWRNVVTTGPGPGQIMTLWLYNLCLSNLVITL